MIKSIRMALLTGLALTAMRLAQGDPEYQLGSGPFVVENLGSPLQANTQEQQFLFRDGNGNLRLLLYYTVTEVWQYPLQMLDVNLDTGAYRLVDGVLGRPGAGGTVYDPEHQKIFLGSSDPGYFMEYDLASGAVQAITNLTQRGLQYGEFGDGGWIYLGESVWAGLERYHPGTGVWENYGDLDPANHNSYYAYTVGADTNFAYVGIGQMPWYLAVVNLQTHQVTLHWKADNDTGGTVSKAVAGGWYYQRINSAQPWYTKWYRLENGTPVEITAAQVPALIPWYKRGNVVGGAPQFPAAYGVEVNLDQAYPDSGNGTNAVIQWRTVGSNEWRSVAVNGFRIRPVVVKQLWPGPGSGFMGFASFYGPVFTYEPASNTVRTLGRTQYSNYDVLVNGSNDIFFSGYTAATVRYDPTRPWTLSASTPDRANTAVNPYKIPLAMGKYHYYMARGADGLIYQACHHERNATGGELGWYNPVSNTVGGRLRDPFLDYDVRDLKAALNGTKLVYSSNNNKLFIFDTASKTIEREIVPVPGVGGLDKVVETAPGVIAGVVGTTFYKADILTGAILLTTNLPAAAFGAMSMPDRRLTVGPDGFLWIYLGNALYRIDPATGAARFITDDTAAYDTVFLGDDLYLYGGTEIRRIRNLFGGGGEEESGLFRYVSLTGTNTLPPFSRWALATTNLQDAINSAVPGNTVLVSNGTYGIQGEIVISNTITVRSVAGAADTVIARQASGTNLPQHRIFRITGNAVLDGFTLRNGYLPALTNNPGSQGGGVLMSAGTVQNCVIVSNGLGNTWTSSGGGIALSGSAKMQFCTVVSNYGGSQVGGVGVYGTGNALLISNTVAYNDGHGAYLANQPTARFCVFEHNNGSGVYGYTVTLSNCVIRNNTAASGGGLFLVNGNTVLDCTIVSNEATSKGGGVYVSGAYSPLLFRRCVISANTNAAGAGLYFAAINPDDGTRTFELCRVTDNPGACSVYLAGVALPVRFRNCTIAGSSGVGVAVDSLATNRAGALMYPAFLNTIVANHATNLFSTNAALLAVLLTNSFTYSCSPQLTAPGLHNVAGDPQFVEPASGNFRIRRSSPCAGTGTTNVFSYFISDLDRAPFGATVSMGCYEPEARSPGGVLMLVR